MLQYIRDKTPADSVIIFCKPRAMRLRTDREAFFTTRCEDLPKGKYVAIVKSIGTYVQISPQLVRHCNPAVVLTAAYEKDDFVVYQITRLPSSGAADCGAIIPSLGCQRHTMRWVISACQVKLLWS